MFQHTESEICSIGRSGLVDQTDPRLPAALEERERTGRFKGELTCLRADGQKFPCELSSVIFTDQDGQLRTSMIIRDITGFKELEEAIKETNAYNRGLIETSLDPLVTIGPDGTITDVNGATELVTGYSRHDLIGTSFSDYFSDTEKAMTCYKMVFAKGTVRDYELEIRHKDGHVIPVLYNASLYRDASGKVTEVFAAARDVTGLKLIEKSLRKSQERISFIADNVPALVAYIDKNGYYRFVNRCYERWFKVPASSITGKHYGEFLGHDVYENIKGYVRQVLSGEPVSFESHMPYALGGERWVYAQYVPDPDEHGQVQGYFGLVTDITTQKLLEKELGESQRFALSVIDSLSAHIAVLDEKGIIIAVNYSWRKFVEDNPPVFVNVNEGANYLSVCDMAQGEDSEMAAMFAAGIRSVISGKGETFSLDYPCHSPDKKRWFIGRAARFSGPGPIRVVVAHEDITERKLTEIKLQESEEKYRNIFNDAILGTYQTTPYGRLLRANTALARMYGYDTPEELINHVTDLTTQSYVNLEDREILKRILSREGVAEKFETQLRKKNGETIWVSINAHIVKDGQGNITHYEGTIEDITERKRVEEALRESEERYKTITEKTIAGIYLIQDGLFRYVNPTFCNIHGYARDELVDKFSPLDRVVEEEKKFLDDKIRRLLSGEQESDQFSIRIRRKDGEIRFLEVFSSYAQYAGKPAVLGTCIDVTEARRANEAIKRSREELRSLTAYLQNVREEERIRIAREIHDELGQSLTGIKIDISWLKKKLSKIVKPADPIQAKIDSLLTLIESTIATTRELSLSLRPGILDDLGLVTAINWQLTRFQEKTGIICMIQSDVAEATIPADYSTVLFRISQECLTNISRYADATKVKITFTGEGESLVLEIEDNGKGITTEQIRNPLSLGILGMRERIMGLNGRFSIKGTPKKGTKVRVELPIR